MWEAHPASKRVVCASEPSGPSLGSNPNILELTKTNNNPVLQKQQSLKDSKEAEGSKKTQRKWGLGSEALEGLPYRADL